MQERELGWIATCGSSQHVYDTQNYETGLNMPANLENSAVATVLKKVSFHSNPKERQCQRMFKLLHNCTHLTRQQSNAHNSPSQTSTVCEPRTSRYSSWIQKRQRNQTVANKIIGNVILRNCCKAVAPSRFAASYKSSEIDCNTPVTITKIYGNPSHP